MYTISNLIQSTRHYLREPFLVAYFVHEFVGRYEDSFVATKSKLEDRAWEVRKSLENTEGKLPYVSASLRRLAIESAGSTSLMFPNNGRPGGPGICSVMVVLYRREERR